MNKGCSLYLYQWKVMNKQVGEASKAFNDIVLESNQQSKVDIKDDLSFKHNNIII